MKLCFSNIAWDPKDSQVVFSFLKKYGFSGIEIAPSILFDNPYAKIEEFQKFSSKIHSDYNFSIPSMQSIWYGQTGNIFNKEDRPELTTYTKKAIDLAASIDCKNLVFGCPKNRFRLKNTTTESVQPFFREIGDYAYKNHTTIAIEANPASYGTNFINTTNDAFDFVKQLGSNGVRVNLDLGTIIKNRETLDSLQENIDLINHIHISEPDLAVITERPEHKLLATILKDSRYANFVSVEMRNPGDLKTVDEAAKYISEIFLND